MILLDASAVLAIILNEAGAERIISSSDDFLVSTVNYAEAGAALVNRAYTSKESIKMLETLTLTMVPMNQDIANTAITLRESTKAFGLSLGDRICLSTAKFLDIPVFTADKNWICMKDIDADIDIRFIR